MGQNRNIWFCIGGSGLDRTDDFQKVCRSGLDRIQFYRIRTGLGLKNFTVRLSLLVTSHSSMLIIVRCSPTQFYIWQKTGCGIWYFLSFQTENCKCWLLRLYLNFLCELNFMGQHIFDVSPWTRNCPNLYTHETHQPNLTYIQVVLKF